jgi:hypothetical protein
MGIGSIMDQRKTLGGVRVIEIICPECVGTGDELEKLEYKGLTITVYDDNHYYVNELHSEFLSFKSARCAIEDVEKDMNEHNAEMDEEDDKFTSLKEYCQDYLAEMDLAMF